MFSTIQEENVIYEATVKSDRGEKLYVGSTGRAFKKRWSEHKLSMNDRQYAKTTLAEHVWELKDEGKKYEISWSIKHRTRADGNKIKKMCLTCNLERWEIAMADKRKKLGDMSTFQKVILSGHKQKTGEASNTASGCTLTHRRHRNISV